MIHILTPTGGRPEGLALLAEYIDAQTLQPDRWVIVDDCEPASYIPKTKCPQAVIYPEWTWDGKNTQSRCMAEALKVVPDDASVAVLEDDDCYLPGHLENVAQALEAHDLVGERQARYYNVRTGRYKTIGGPSHAALASTAVRGRALALLRRICAKGSRRIDMELWRGHRGHLLDSTNVVGIKGLPGRAGIGIGHRHTFGAPDPGHVLKDWVGDYADNYGPFRA